MIIHPVVIRPVSDRRFIDCEWIRLGRVRFRYIGGREEKLFFELFVVATFNDGSSLVLDNVAVPTVGGWVGG